MVVWLETETWEIGKGGLKGGQKGVWLGEEFLGLLGFVAFV
jgi:hypothetical protein